MEEETTLLLMKKCGTLDQENIADEKDHEKFRTQLVTELKHEAYDRLCVLFVMTYEDGEGSFLRTGAGG